MIRRIPEGKNISARTLAARLDRFTPEWLLTGTTPQQFFARYYDRGILHLTGRPPGFYSRLIDFDDIESLLARSSDDLRKNLVVCRNGMDYFQRNDRPKSMVLMVREAFAEGYTIGIYNAEERWPSIARLARACTEWLICETNVAVFLSPPGTQAFERHFDIYDGFVLQIEGQKTWRIFAPSDIADPQAAHGDQIEPALPRTVTLSPGDLLYVPREYLHEVSAEGDASLHLTIAVKTYIWRDFLNDLIAAAGERQAMLARACRLLPGRGSAAPDLPPLVKRLMAAVAPDLGDDTASLVLDRARGRLAERLSPLPRSLFFRHQRRRSVHADDKLVRAEGAIASVLRQGNHVVLVFPGDSMAAPPAAAAALRFMAGSTAPFSIGELPGSLSEKARLLLAGRLVKIGFLEILGDTDL